MSQPVIGFAGMTHLGLVSGVSASEKGFRLICFDPDTNRIADIIRGKLPVSEPHLNDLVAKNKTHLTFTADASSLAQCDIVYLAPDVPTDDTGNSDLGPISELLDIVFAATRPDTVIVVLSQVPPGFSRSKLRPGRIFYYQVETLIFGRAVERALYPERYIVGCEDPKQPFPSAFETFLKSHDCPILPMRFESAELAKISINMCLVASVSTANTIAELCEKIGADWSEIVPALKLDRRIGQYSYLTPGLGISGGNLERDLATICNFADEHHTDASVVRSWIANSQHRKRWAVNVLRTVLPRGVKNPVIAVWGLSYKENTHSTKNSPALVAISQLSDFGLRVFDPIVPWNPAWHGRTTVCESVLETLEGADALLIMTPWSEFKSVAPDELAGRMKGRLVIDPYAILSADAQDRFGFEVHTLGRQANKSK